MARKWILPLILILGVLISGCSEGQEKDSSNGGEVEVTIPAIFLRVRTLILLFQRQKAVGLRKSVRMMMVL